MWLDETFCQRIKTTKRARERELLEIVLSFQKVTVLTGFPLKHDQLKK